MAAAYLIFYFPCVEKGFLFSAPVPCSSVAQVIPPSGAVDFPCCHNILRTQDLCQCSSLAGYHSRSQVLALSKRNTCTWIPLIETIHSGRLERI